MEIIEYILANIDYVVEYRKKDLGNKMNEEDKNFGISAILRTLEISKVK